MSSAVPWSFSLLQSFETCPRRHHLTRVTHNVVEATTPALASGRAVHKAMEDGVNGKAIPTAFNHLRPIIARIRESPGTKHTEQKWAVTKTLNKCGYYDDGAWARGVLDLSVVRPKTAIVLDYKSGKIKQDSDQLKLFAAACFTLYPFVETVKTGYAWLDYNRITSEEYQREDAPLIWQEFVPRVERLERAVAEDCWEPNPSGLCGWCPVGRANCEFWKGYRGEHRG